MRSDILTTSAVLAIFTALPVAAATCVATDGSTIRCVAASSDPVVSDANGVTVRVDSAAEIVSDTDEVAAITLTGDATSVENDGRIAFTGEDGYAVTGDGSGMTVTNRGRIESGDRGIEMIGGSGLAVVNDMGGTITSVAQAVRSQEDVPGARVENAGTITATEGRAVQLRGFGSSLANTGTLIGGEEVVEARGDFRLENSGTIRLADENVLDEDGVQFASGEAINSGTIRGTDDGIDLDEGRVENLATGRIFSVAPDDVESAGGIDIDPEYDDEGVNPIRPSGPLTVVNAGLIEGPRAINADPATVSELTIENTGTLRGRSGLAISMAPGQGDSSLALTGNSRIEGDVVFGGGDDMLIIGDLTSTLLSTGIFDGGDGADDVLLEGYGIGDFFDVIVGDDTLGFSLLGGAGPLEAVFADFESWTLGGISYGATDLAAAVSGPAPVPLPASLPLLLAALGGTALLRRRR